MWKNQKTRKVGYFSFTFDFLTLFLLQLRKNTGSWTTAGVNEVYVRQCNKVDEPILDGIRN
jgi:hypothetical protein